MSIITPPIEIAASTVRWPRKYDLFGVQVSATTYDEVISRVLQAANQRVSAVASFHAVHAVITASGDPQLREMVNSFEIVAPDGQPVRWALNRLYRTDLRNRVYGPELMWRLCREAAHQGVAIYLYGGTDEVIEKLQNNLTTQFPNLQIAGCEAPPFRPLTEQEDREVVQRINASGAGLVFIGLGCPKQDIFAYEHRGRIAAVQLCVGAAFDFHAGVKQTAPVWMQRRGLEWLFRLWQEPRRLFRRYFETNTLFLIKLAAAMICRRRSHR